MKYLEAESWIIRKYYVYLPVYLEEKQYNKE